MAAVQLSAGVGSSVSMSLGMAPSFLISGNLLCVGPQWWIVGAYRNNFWDLHGKFFTRLEFDGQGLVLRCPGGSHGGESQRPGSFHKLFVMGNVLYSDKGILARLIEDPFLWYFYTTKNKLRDLMIEAADQNE
jgi:hypothetical protein